MADTFTLSRVMQLGPEATPGVVVPATKRMQTLNITPDVDETAQTFMPSGESLPTVAALSQARTTSRAQGWPSFGELPYPLAGTFGLVSPTVPVGGFRSRQWRWDYRGSVFVTPKTFTCEYGDTAQGEQIPYFVFDGGTFAFDRRQVQYTAAPFGAQLVTPFSLTTLTPVSAVQTISITGAPTGGTFTLTWNGSTTAAIPYNATAAAVAAALAALPNIGTGNVTATGGPLPTTPVPVTFAGLLGNQPAALITGTGTGLTGGTTPAVAIANTTTGVAVTPEPVIQPIVPNTVNIFVDTSPGNFGVTQFLRDFEANLNFSGLEDQAWPLNSALSSFGTIAPKAPTAQTNMTVSMDAQGLSLLNALRAGTRQYVRYEAIGPLIEGTIHYRFTIDMAVNITRPGAVRPMNGVFTRQFQGQVMDDAVWGQAMQITVVNTLPSL